MNGVWSGRWVADRLGIRLVSDSPESPLHLTDLTGLALRRNPRRAHLLVSSVLGKHVPTDPRIVYGAGRLLGALVADALTGESTGIVETGGGLLKSALDGSPDAADALLALCATRESAGSMTVAGFVSSTTVLGFAETATALGHAVADALDADYLHSTRRRCAGADAAGGFEEEHSHATSHLLLPEDREILSRSGPLVLVDDELSTGRTALNTIQALHAYSPRSRYVIATLVDLRSDDDRKAMAGLGTSLGAAIEVVALVAGCIELPAGILGAGQRLVAEHDTTYEVRSGQATPIPVPVAGWGGAREGGRHGFGSYDRAALHTAAEKVAVQLAAQLTGERVLVLGFEELMYAPLLIANHLTGRLSDTADVRFSATTRSPVLAVDDPGYAIRTVLCFPSHDDPDDGPAPRYAYNIAAGFTDIVFVVDDAGDTDALHAPGGLLDQLAGCCDQVHLLALPSYCFGDAE
ncbi:phosphoribosyltransferase family protein [Micromonospora pattaloongensis]|uniref:phosphoribosyltransferase family protein n=1 Tax=Micromonospora pattaloongensis TaxID=405436 RepID=UPI001587ADED|nr:phosphoribosyltransferase family protein [Micromonospora pattaloongensis]